MGFLVRDSNKVPIPASEGPTVIAVEGP